MLVLTDCQKIAQFSLQLPMEMPHLLIEKDATKNTCPFKGNTSLFLQQVQKALKLLDEKVISTPAHTTLGIWTQLHSQLPEGIIYPQKRLNKI